jgi:hypothetical protein
MKTTYIYPNDCELSIISNQIKILKPDWNTDIETTTVQVEQTTTLQPTTASTSEATVSTTFVEQTTSEETPTG